MSSMAQQNWSPRNLRKSKGSYTAGKDKNENCRSNISIAGQTKKFWARTSRSYKLPGYAAWCAAMDQVNGMKRG